MKVSEIRYVLEKALSQLNRIESPNEVKMCHTIDTGGYGGDCEEIYEFDLGLSYDEEDNVIFFEYFGDTNPGTPGIPGTEV
jgi:hypothetical protein